MSLWTGFESSTFDLTRDVALLFQVTLPVYLNSTRAELLFTLDFKAEGMTDAGDHHYYERGVSLLSSPL